MGVDMGCRRYDAETMAIQGDWFLSGRMWSFVIGEGVAVLREAFAKNRLLDYLLIAVSSMLIAFFLVAFLGIVQQVQAGGSDVFDRLSLHDAAYILLLGAAFFVAFLFLSSTRCKPALELLFRSRFIIGGLVVLLAVVFEISGSSIAQWGNMLGEGGFRGVLFGIPRAIRSDEWGVFTPFAFSQEWAGYAPVSDILRGTQTDVTLVYAQPCWSFSTLFRPFLWGYLLLGSAKGLAFFWTGRLVCLFLVSLQFGLLLTGNRRWLSLAFANMIAFSPFVQWWFAVNGTAELLIFGQGLVLALNAFLRTASLKARYGFALLLSWMATGFVLILYPAWQVPFFWIFLLLGIGLAYETVKSLDGKIPLSSRGSVAGPAALAIFLLVISLLLVFLPHSEVVHAVSETAYPGQRADFGGDGMWTLANSAYGLVSSINASETPINVCESAGFISLAPSGIIAAVVLSVVLRVKARRYDSVLMLAALLEMILLIYVVVGFIAPFASLSLLSHATAGRVGQLIGFVDLVVCFRCSSYMNLNDPSESVTVLRSAPLYSIPSSACFLLTVSAPLICVSVILYAATVKLRLLFTAAVCLFVFALAVALFAPRKERKRFASGFTIFAVSCVVFATGMFVNPIQKGAGPILDSPVYKSIQNIVREDSDALWMADDSWLGQFAAAAGASSVNSVNTYPYLSRWQLLDATGSNEDIYNRYAHINLEIANSSTSFELLAADSFKLTASFQDLKKLGVRYLISRRDDLPSFNSQSAAVRLAERAGSIYIYEIV